MSELKIKLLVWLEIEINDLNKRGSIDSFSWVVGSGESES